MLSLHAEIQEAKGACQSMAHLDGGDVLCYDVCCVGSRVEQSTLKPVSEDKQYSSRGDSQKLNTLGCTLFLAPSPPPTDCSVWSYGLLKSNQSVFHTASDKQLECVCECVRGLGMRLQG